MYWGKSGLEQQETVTVREWIFQEKNESINNIYYIKAIQNGSIKEFMRMAKKCTFSIFILKKNLSFLHLTIILISFIPVVK